MEKVVKSIVVGAALSVTPLDLASAASPDLECVSTPMVKTIFLFRRNPARSEADFEEHYIHNHAVLGRNLTTSLKGYTVNIVQHPGSQDPNSVTEHWVQSTPDGFPLWTTATPDEQNIVTADDRTMFDRAAKDGGNVGGGGPYVVNMEVTVLAGEPLASPLYQATPEFKTFLLYPDIASLPKSVPAGARRVVDSYVAYKQMGTEKAKSDIAVFRSVWSSKPLQKLPGVKMFETKEYRQIIPPSMNWCVK